MKVRQGRLAVVLDECRYLLFCLGQCLLTFTGELDTTLERGQGFLEAQLTGLHLLDDPFELCQRIFERAS